MESMILTEGPDYLCLTVGVCLWEMADGSLYLEEDYKVAGDVWRVNKNDADLYPSNPHAHCIDGRFPGHKLHLGTRQLYTSKNKPTTLYLAKDKFERLLEMVRPKFPEMQFPLI